MSNRRRGIYIFAYASITSGLKNLCIQKKNSKTLQYFTISLIKSKKQINKGFLKFARIQKNNFNQTIRKNRDQLNSFAAEKQASWADWCIGVCLFAFQSP